MLHNGGRRPEGQQGHLMLRSTYDLPTHSLASVGVCTWSFPELLHWAPGAAASVLGCDAGNLSARCSSPLGWVAWGSSIRVREACFSLPRPWTDSINWLVLPKRRKSSLSFHTWASLTQALSQESWWSLELTSRTFCFFLEGWWDQGVYLSKSLWELLEG